MPFQGKRIEIIIWDAVAVFPRIIAGADYSRESDYIKIFLTNNQAGEKVKYQPRSQGLFLGFGESQGKDPGNEVGEIHEYYHRKNCKKLVLFVTIHCK